MRLVELYVQDSRLTRRHTHGNHYHPRPPLCRPNRQPRNGPTVAHGRLAHHWQVDERISPRRNPPDERLHAEQCTLAIAHYGLFRPTRVKLGARRRSSLAIVADAFEEKMTPVRCPFSIRRNVANNPPGIRLVKARGYVAHSTVRVGAEIN